MAATTLAGAAGYLAYWIGQIARRYNRDGPDGVRDRCHRLQRSRLLLAPEQQGEVCTWQTGPDGMFGRFCECAGSFRTRKSVFAPHAPP
jgi:hypothetical protein